MNLTSPYLDDIEAGRRISSSDLGPDLTAEYWIARAAARRVALAFLNRLIKNKVGPKVWEEYRKLAFEVAPD